ncbi:excalibur calcium-binding domain-containing protein [Bacillus cereus]|uniref:excalibur calcium-binding domain-containing protein n=1 Tax=Bacillus cereus TaxID=1396 RepID=UPI000BF8D630|nr:excalibur calcium-binding domain-containing protein [Bacillus cereus]PFD74633.1 calcium-binding protein [Bacillus cereus]PFK37872.1 calcium-binding protein [Bacillus cereus]PFN01622.1 calcium-binding protein [Bacillus cereus]PFR23582.1 calcium-binding protein [Bacillus cereus]PFV12917.1 calcium-binding protein [Bacillus cereus]
MTILSNIGVALFLIAFILLILCIISFFKKNGKAKQYGRPAVILFMISIVLIITSAESSNNPIVEFFSILSFVLFVFFLVLAILSVIKKTGVAKKQFIITAILFVIFVALLSISAPSSEKTAATSKQVASNTTEHKDSDKKELEKKEADEKTQKQEKEKLQAEEQAHKQEDEKRLADEQARKQQEEQKKSQQTQTQPASGNTSSAYYKNCAAVRSAGKAPLYKGQPGYDSHLDRDGDGVACEK